MKLNPRLQKLRVDLHELRMDLADRVSSFPLLRLLLCELRFLVIFLCFIGFLMFLALFLPKIWTSSPAGFKPIIKVSGLDLAQAWSLKRSARSAMAAQKWDNATYCWEAAIANNSADTDSIRGMLNLISINPEARRARGANVPLYAHWLLRLAATNETDVVLCVRALNSTRAFEESLSLLATRKNSPEVELRAAYLRALFETGQYPEFNQAWEQAPESVRQMPLVRLCQDAWTAGWASSGAGAAARQHLDQAALSAEWGIEASRIQIHLAKRLLDVSLFEQAFTRLKTAGVDGPKDHAAHWLLLQAAGKTEQARKDAESYVDTGSSPGDALVLADAQLKLASPEIAQRTLKQAAQRTPGSVELWMALSNVLVSQRQWQELAEVVWQIRATDRVRAILLLHSYYLEARAESNLGRRANAEDAFRKIAESPPGNPRIARLTASGLIEIGQHELARNLLDKIETENAQDPVYWQSLVVASVGLKDAALLKRAATRAYELSPNNPVCRNNYAAALLIFREKPETSIQLTFEVLRANPRSVQATLNHALALAQNHRFNEARDLTQGITESGLEPLEILALRLCRLEIYAGTGQNEQARVVAASIDRRKLMDPQLAWFDQQLASLSGTNTHR